MALGKQIKKYRLEKGWTLEQLEEASGVAVGTISALENRDSVRSNYARQLAQALGLRLEDLLDEATHHVAENTADWIKPAHPEQTQQVQNSMVLSVSLHQALSVLAYHMNGLDPPTQQAVGVMVAGMCSNPATADVTGRRIAAMLDIQGNEQAPKSTNSHAA